MASTSVFEFSEDEIPVQPPQQIKKPKKTSAKAKALKTKKSKVENDGSSDSDDNNLPTRLTKKRVKKPNLFLDEDYDVNPPIRATALRNFLYRKTSAGYTSQTKHSARGEYYIELRVYHSKDLEAIPNDTNRWKKAFVTFKGAIEENSPTFSSVCDVVKAVKEEYKDIRPVLYPSSIY